MPIGKLDHFSIRTLDIEASRRFYTEVMGFKEGFRPPFKFPGLWLYNDVPYPDSYGVVHINREISLLDAISPPACRHGSRSICRCLRRI